jgi:acyl-[acyl-carrier-protein]-phospholipid O-acyltransferase/long-chain-fatty-acid--[acyl-carrier-protein] ligase
VAVKVVHPESFEELSPGAEGLLLVRGPNVMQGYLDEPVLTREVVRDGWYVTGDIARVDADGFIEITDRLARFSKIGGEMVPHGKIEDALSAAGPGVEFAVASLAGGPRGERLVVVHTRLPDGLTPGLLAGRLRASGIPNLWAPRPDAFVEVKAMPRTGTGKLELRAVREIARERLGATAGQR